MAPPLIAVAHGSRDPRSAATVHELLGVVRALAPRLDVRAAFLDLSAPRLSDVLAGVHADGHDDAVVVPLLLGRAFHARVDVPGAVAKAARRHPRLRIGVADVLGPDPGLEAAAFARLIAAGADPTDPVLGVVLAGAGSSHGPANVAVQRVADGWVRSTRWSALAGFAAAADPDVPTAVAALRAAGARRIAVGSWFLAPGLLPDRVISQARTADPAVLVADPLGADPDVADVVLRRYAAVAQLSTARQAS
ncbi:MAG TPA: sirohydrochlorin chelatase [Pseudonocardiaceae bacterium]|nr:sirohydrochlorin chelatase [Pseudonocardiaceae bacterium]